MSSEQPARDLDVLVVGDANPDLILRGDVVPRFGQSEQLLERADLTIGGSGAIVAHGLARLGLRTALFAVVGDDTFGAMARAQLAAAGVDVSRVGTDPLLPTGLSVILTHGQSRTMLTLVGSIGALDPADVDDELLYRTRHVHASSFYLQPTLAAGLAGLFARAHAAGASTSLDTNLDPAGEWAGLDDVLAVTDVLLPNRTEVLGIAARFGEPVDDVVEAARRIAARGPVVVVKDGERGAVSVAVTGGGGAGASGVTAGSDVGVTKGAAGEVLRETGVRIDAIDSTGAGDSFDAAFLAALVRGLPAAERLRLACRAGAMSTLGIGGTATQPTAAELGLCD